MRRNHDAAVGLKTPRFLALGDSYTIGTGAPPEARWPAQLVGRLRAEGIAIEAPEIVAQNGWTTSELAAAIEKAGLKPEYDLVSLMVGVNDQFSGRSGAAYRSGFVSLLAGAIRLAGGAARRVIAISIPDWSVTPFAAGRDRGAIATEIERFNAINLAEAERAGARYVDVTTLSQRMGANPAILAEDGLHPSEEMYRAWVNVILPVARSALREG